MGIMSINPDLYQEKVHDIRELFINFHHLLNEYRPHQARESLIMMMESQLARSKAETEGIKNMKAKVEGILAGLGQMKLADGISNEAQRTSRSSDDFEDEKGVWDELRREFG
jgi:mediator of RNA polymerase II transcription subunit 7